MAEVLSKFSNSVNNYMELLPRNVVNLTSDLLEGSDFISRTIGMDKSYSDIMFMIRSIGSEPISLLGKDYMFIYDHVRRNYLQGTQVSNEAYGIPKFTFYKERPTIKFVNPYDDVLNLKDRWFPNIRLEDTSDSSILRSYAESSDGKVENKEIEEYDKDTDKNVGVKHGIVYSFRNELRTKDLIRKTNDNFNNGKYSTIVARFHTNSDESKDMNDIKQTAISSRYGMSHGRNLLKTRRTTENGYDNPYCRVWTYHHQYDRMTKAIRPFFDDVNSYTDLEKRELEGSDYKSVGFRTKSINSSVNVELIAPEGIEAEKSQIGGSKNEFLGGSALLDKYGVLNYSTGFVNIAPTAKIIDYFNGTEDSEQDKKTVSTRRCMFSIENLAWRTNGTKNSEFDPSGLSPEQRGPLGGRIMWFPPYNINFSEEARVEWNSNQFIGRGEKIYTYTNTERSGTLSFTLLIDHPSIIDYWNKDSIPNSDGGVDDIQNQENTLLRFFAGCEVLSAKPQEFFKDIIPQKEEEEIESDVENNVSEADETEDKEFRTICCNLFFPNNYSGVDDRNSTTFNPIHYLMNGVGTGKVINKTNGEHCFEAVDYLTFIDRKISENVYECTIKENTTKCREGHDVNDCTEYPCNENGLIEDYDSSRSSLTTFNGGYETVIDGMGISPSLELIGKDNIDKTYACNSVKGRFITNENGEKRYAIMTKTPTEGEELYECFLELAKINGPTPRYSWCYRVDDKWHTQELKKEPINYVDTASFGLNGQGFEEVRKKVKEFGIEEDSDKYKLISFVDLFSALEEGQKIFSSQDYNKKNYELIKELKKNQDRIISVEFKGHASSQGYDNQNIELADNRAETFKNWFEGLNFAKDKLKVIHLKNEEKTQSTKSNPNVGGGNTELSKMWRSAEVIIKYTSSSSEHVQTSQNSDANRINANIANGETSNVITINNTDESILKSGQYKANIFGKPFIVNAKTEGDSEDTVKGTKNPTVNRYDNEGEFFESLEKNQPFLHHLISEKVKYFDPAFHSISPEGFNARLTFLHQCTRQGSTAENANFETSVAYNLAFGRPPVCVLRLGDFYNTKILINSLSIQYENPTWDLNPEGIGVMPMFATVSLSFVFIGGSDIAGPIARLQNAVSFNYYANTSVYDNRADRVIYDPQKTGKEIAMHINDYTK